jgi:hypothetical protein
MTLPTIIQCEHCGQVVCNVCYCTGVAVLSEPKPVEPTRDILDTLYHQLWDELHTQVKTAEQFAEWVNRVPSFGCGCANWLRDYVRDNPPTDDLREYGWRLHNSVSRKLNKTEFSWDEFEAKYPNTT